ncbi:hypothetical protein, partial [Prosthecobacter sp.]|uniref:hypothetical protein n=1 Tax=Prosthecobacter sp. TaxID=1965333 RepID=UPI0025DFAE88
MKTAIAAKLETIKQINPFGNGLGDRGSGVDGIKMSLIRALRYAGWVKAEGICRSRRPAIQ